MSRAATTASDSYVYAGFDGSIGGVLSPTVRSGDPILNNRMLNMYKKKPMNIAIFAGGAASFAIALWLVRSQATVDDTDYMKAMIPHHSIAIMTSERAQISDPRVRKLADQIIEAQRREISEMKFLINDLERAN